MAKDRGRGSSKYDKARERAKQRAQESGRTSNIVALPSGVEFEQIEKGSMHLDIVPYEVTVSNNKVFDKGDIADRLDYLVHRDIGPEGVMVVCPGTFGMPCPICEEAKQMKEDKPNRSKEEWKRDIAPLMPKKRTLFNVDTKDGIKVLDISFHNFTALLDEEINQGDEEWSGYALPQGGFTLGVRFKDKSMGERTFLEASRIDFKERDDYDDNILKDTVDLDKALVVQPYDKLTKLFIGAAPDDDEQDDEPKKRGGRRSAPEEHTETEPFGEQDKDDDDKDRGSRRRSRGRNEEDEPKDKGRSRSRGKDEDDPKDKDEDDPKDKGDDDDDKGSGRTRSRRARPDDDDVDKGSGRSRGKDKDDAAKGECPDGGKFGVDTDDRDHCIDCKVWSECRDMFDAKAVQKHVDDDDGKDDRKRDRGRDKDDDDSGKGGGRTRSRSRR